MADESLARTHQAVGAYQQTVCALGSAGTRRLAVSGVHSPRVHNAARRRGLRVSLCKRGGARRILRGRPFYVWQPDLEKRWPPSPPPSLSERATEPPERASEPLDLAPDVSPRRKPGKLPTKEWPTHVVRELIRRARAGEETPTAPEMCQFCQDTLNWQPDIRQMQRLLRELRLDQ
jgi:hypothetical protein